MAINYASIKKSSNLLAIPLWCSLLLMVSMSLHADEKELALDTLMKDAGADLVIETFVEEMSLEQVKERIVSAESEGGLSETERALYLDGFNLNGMKIATRQLLLQALTLNEIVELNAFFSNPTIKKMLAADMLYDRADGTKSSKQYLLSILRKPPSPSRITLIHKLVDASLYVEQQVYLNGVITLERNKIPKVYFGTYDEEGARKLEHFVESYKQNMVNAIRPDMRLVFMRVYRDLTDDELSELIQLFQSPLRLKYQAVFFDAFATVVADSLKGGLTAILDHRKKN